jgi:hypothetical protein
MEMLVEAFRLIGVSGAKDPVTLDLITERRWRETTPGGRYAWCGDFTSYLAEHAGCQNGSALNRVSLNGTWVPGDNITRVVRWAQHNGFIGNRDNATPGDFIVTPRTSGDHIAIISGRSSTEFELINGNGMNAEVSPSKRLISAPTRWIIQTLALFDLIEALPRSVAAGARPYAPPLPGHETFGITDAETYGYECAPESYTCEWLRGLSAKDSVDDDL